MGRVYQGYPQIPDEFEQWSNVAVTRVLLMRDGGANELLYEVIIAWKT